MAGGEGRRLKPLTDSIPKVLLPICNIPTLSYLLSSLAQQKVIDGVILSLGHLWDKVISYLATYKSPLPIETKIEKEPLDTGGAIKFSAPSEEEFFVVNGDIICDVDLKSMLDFHKRKKADITILSVKVKDVSSFGTLEFDGNFRLKSFIEKVPERRAGFVNGAIYLMKGKVIEYFPQGKVSLERDILPLLLTRKLNTFVFPHFGYWIDIGDRERYIQVNKDAMNGILFLKYFSFPYKKGNDVEIHFPVVFGEGCELGDRVKLLPYSVIGRFVKLGEGAVIEESVILDKVIVGSNCRISRSIISSSSLLHPDTVLENTIV